MSTWKVLAIAAILAAGASKVMAAQALPTDANKFEYVTVGNVDGESDDIMSVVTVRLSTKPSFTKVPVEDHGTFLQAMLPTTIVPRPGEFIDAKSPYFSKIALFQVEPETTALRIFTNVESGKLAKFTTAEILNDRLVVTLDHRQLPADLIKKDAKADASKVEVAAKTADGSSPAELIKDKPAETTVMGDASQDLNKKLYMVSIFSGFMILGLIAFQMLKAINKKKRSLYEQDTGVEIRTLSSTNIMPKQKLVLIEACNERILLAVSPDRVSCITTFPMAKVAAQATAAPRAAMSQLMQNAIKQKQVSPGVLKEPSVGISLKPKDTIELESPQQPVARRQVEDQVKTMPQPTQVLQANSAKKVQAKKINIAIDDNFQTNRSAKKGEGVEDRSHAINDVTKLIREKLKSIGNQA